MHDADQRRDPALSKSMITLFACVVIWLVLITTYVALTATHHPLPPPQLNSLALAGLACLTICSFIGASNGRFPTTVDVSRFDAELRHMRDEIEQNGVDRDQLIASVHDVLRINARLPGAD